MSFNTESHAELGGSSSPTGSEDLSRETQRKSQLATFFSKSKQNKTGSSGPLKTRQSTTATAAASINNDVNAHLAADVLCRMVTHSNKFSLVSSAAFRLSPSTSVADLMEIGLKKFGSDFSKQAPAMICVGTITLPKSERKNRDDGDDRGGSGHSFSDNEVILRTLKASDSPLFFRDAITAKLTARLVSLKASLSPHTVNIQWIYKSNPSLPLDLSGQVSGIDDDSDGEDDDDYSSPLNNESRSGGNNDRNRGGSNHINSTLNYVKPPENFVKAGYLHLRSNNDENLWREKWCVLGKEDFFICSSKKHLVPAIRVSLVRNRVSEIHSSKSIPHGVELEASHRTFEFMAHSRNEQSTWVKSLSGRIEIATDNSFIEMAEQIVMDEETVRGRRLDIDIKTTVKNCGGLPHGRGHLWQRTHMNKNDEGADLMDAVRLQVGIVKFKEVCRHRPPTGPSWMARKLYERQWAEALWVCSEFLGGVEHNGGNVLSKTLKVADESGFLDLEASKAAVKNAVKVGLEQVQKGKVDGPDKDLFDKVLGCMVAIARKEKLYAAAAAIR
jgi:hypothetical protein